MPQIEEPKEYTLKKYEEVYHILKNDLKNEDERFTYIESKASTQFTLLIYVLGIATLGFGEYFKIISVVTSYWQTLFMISYPLIILCSFISIFLYSKVLEFGSLQQLSNNNELLDFYKKHRYIDVLNAMCKSLILALESNSQITNRKLNYASRAFLFTKITMAVVFISLIIYSIIKYQKLGG